MVQKIIYPNVFIRAIPGVLLSIGIGLLLLGVVDFFIDFISGFLIFVGLALYIIGGLAFMWVDRNTVISSGSW